MSTSEVEIKNITSEEYLQLLRSYSLYNTVFHFQHPAWLQVKKTWSKEILGFFCNRKLVAGSLALYRQPSRYVSLSLMYVPGGVITNDFLNINLYLSCLKNYASKLQVTSLYYSDFNVIKTWKNKAIHNNLYSTSKKKAASIDSISECESKKQGSVIENLLMSLHFKPNFIGEFDGYNARYVVTIDLKQGIEQIYKNFSSRWKRSIKKAEKHKINIVLAGEDDLPIFYSLYKKTASRSNFLPRQSEYFQNLTESISVANDIDYRLYIAYLNDKPISSALILDTYNYSCYLYGGSDEESTNNVRGAHLLHYRIMQDSIERKKSIYDLKGVANNLKNSPVLGLTHFKIGSGGDVIKHVGEWQYGVNRIKHRIFHTALKIRSLLH